MCAAKGLTVSMLSNRIPSYCVLDVFLNSYFLTNIVHFWLCRSAKGSTHCQTWKRRPSHMRSCTHYSHEGWKVQALTNLGKNECMSISSIPALLLKHLKQLFLCWQIVIFKFDDTCRLYKKLDNCKLAVAQNSSVTIKSNVISSVTSLCYCNPSFQ